MTAPAAHEAKAGGLGESQVRPIRGSCHLFGYPLNFLGQLILTPRCRRERIAHRAELRIGSLLLGRPCSFPQGLGRVDQFLPSE